MAEEIWKDIPEYKGIYQVSNSGRVKSLGNEKSKKERILKPIINPHGYCFVYLCMYGKSKAIYIHQLVAICFLGHKPCGYKLVINHKNFIRTDNRVENLEIVTQKENLNHYHRNREQLFSKLNEVSLEYLINIKKMKDKKEPKKAGRPTRYGEEAVVLAVKVPKSQYEYMKNIIELLLKQFEA